MSIPKTSVRKPVTVLIICILIFILGLNAVRQISVELTPDMDIPYIIVSTTYNGASPEEIEEKVTKTLESSLASVGGMEKLTSTSKKGSSTITMQFSIDTNLDEASNTIRDRIDLVKKYLPKDAENPMVVKIDLSMMPLVVLAMDSPSHSAEELKKMAEDIISPRLEHLDGVASTSIIGGRTRAIKIDIPKDRLEGYGLSFSQIAQMIGAQNANSSVGSITENGFEYTIETEGTFDSVEEIANTVISYKTGADRQPKEIRLGEIADVYDGYKDATSTFLENGRDCVGITVSKQTGKNTVAISQMVLDELDGIRKMLPSDCTLEVMYNSADEINNSISEVENSAVQGAILAVIVLLFFLRSGRSTIIIGITIPLSIILTMLVMFYADLTLNLMTLAGLALGIGMLVDNAIVILENIYSYRERGTKPAVAAVLGSEEMVSAITSSTLTTICVFLPMIMYESKLGMAGQMFNDLALTVVISLLSSLILAISLVPVLAGKYLVSQTIGKSEGNFLFNFVGKILDAIDSAYSKAVTWVFNHKKIFVIFILGLFIFSMLMISALGFVYMPDTDQTSLTVKFEMPKGTDLETTSEAMRRFDEEARNIVKGIKISGIIAGSGMSSMQGTDSSSGNIMYMFYNASERQEGWDSGKSAKAKLETLMSEFPEAKISISLNSSMSTSSASGDLDIKIASNNLDDCRKVAAEVEALLKEKCKDSVKEVDSDLEDGLPQISIIYDRDKMYSLGINIASVNAELKANIGGMTSGRYSDGGSDIDIILSLPKSDRRSVSDLDSIMITSSFGYQVPLSSFAKIVEDRGALQILRENQSRVVTVTANRADGVATTAAKDAVEKAINENIVLPSGTMITYEGSYKEAMKFLKLFVEIILIAILLVFAIMASQFESFLSPFIILFTLPLGLIGVVLMYVLYRTPLNVITAVGFLILVGVVVNNGIVLVDYTNLLRKRGMKLAEACLEAAKSRLRPVLMTTLTTILALVPMAFFPGDGGELVQHIGLTVFGGLTFGTLMTLFLIPCLYYFFNRRKARKEEAAFTVEA